MRPLRRTSFEHWQIEERRRSLWRRLSAPQLFVGSFGLLILAGHARAASAARALHGGAPGLAGRALHGHQRRVRHGAHRGGHRHLLHPAGQAWILLLIQLGGLGIITFTTLIIVALGRRLSLRARGAERQLGGGGAARGRAAAHARRGALHLRHRGGRRAAPLPALGCRATARRTPPGRRSSTRSAPSATPASPPSPTPWSASSADPLDPAGGDGADRAGGHRVPDAGGALPAAPATRGPAAASASRCTPAWCW